MIALEHTNPIMRCWNNYKNCSGEVKTDCSQSLRRPDTTKELRDNILTWNVLKRKRKQVRFWWQSLGTCGKNTLNLKYNLLVITGKGFISLQSCKLVLHCLGYDGIQYSLRALSCEWDLAELLIIFMKVKWKNNFQIRLPCTG